jgi:hypothetical protein
MKNKQILVLLAISLIGFGIGYVLTNSTIFNLCLHDQYVCRALLNRIGDPLFYGMGALAIVFFVLFFTPQAFSAWKKFAIWFVPLATLLFIFYPDPGSGDLFSPYPEQVFQLVSGLYVFISLAVIIWKYFFPHRES